jgi:hypothetical protein
MSTDGGGSELQTAQRLHQLEKNMTNFAKDQEAAHGAVLQRLLAQDAANVLFQHEISKKVDAMLTLLQKQQ